jgi:hypothetical protein
VEHCRSSGEFTDANTEGNGESHPQGNTQLYRHADHSIAYGITPSHAFVYRYACCNTYP